MSKTIFEKYIGYSEFKNGNIKKIYDGYHDYTAYGGMKYRFVNNAFSLINWDNDRLKIPKSTYALSTDHFNELIPKNLIEDSENLKHCIVRPDTYIELDQSDSIYDGYILNLMLKINGNTKFPYLYKTLENVLYLYKNYDKTQCKFQGMLCPTINIKHKVNYQKITSF